MTAGLGRGRQYVLQGCCTQWLLCDQVCNRSGRTGKHVHALSSDACTSWPQFPSLACHHGKCFSCERCTYVLWMCQHRYPLCNSSAWQCPLCKSDAWLTECIAELPSPLPDSRSVPSYWYAKTCGSPTAGPQLSAILHAMPNTCFFFPQQLM